MTFTSDVVMMLGGRSDMNQNYYTQSVPGISMMQLNHMGDLVGEI